MLLCTPPSLFLFSSLVPCMFFPLFGFSLGGFFSLFFVSRPFPTWPSIGIMLGFPRYSFEQFVPPFFFSFRSSVHVLQEDVPPSWVDPLVARRNSPSGKGGFASSSLFPPQVWLEKHAPCVSTLLEALSKENVYFRDPTWNF